MTMADAPLSAQEMLDALLDLDSSVYRLTNWEINFIDSVDKRPTAWSISEKQTEVIRKIYVKAFPKG
jgi:hypothetical protein